MSEYNSFSFKNIQFVMLAENCPAVWRLL